MKTQKLQSALTSLYDLQKNKLVMILIKKKKSNSDNKSKQKKY